MDTLKEEELTYFQNQEAKSSLAEIFGKTAPLQRDTFSLAFTKLEKGGMVVRHHHHISEEDYLFVKGHATMFVDGKRIEVEPGSVVSIHPEENHEIPKTEEEVCFYALSIPPYTPEDFITEEKK